MRDARRFASIVLSRDRLRRVEARGTRSSCLSSVRSSWAGSTGPADQAMRSPAFIRTAMSISSVILGTSLLAECGDAFREMGASAHSISQLLFQGLPGSCVVGNAGADLRLYRLDRRWTVRRDLNRSFDGSGHDIGAWQHAVDECDAGCELGSNETSGEQQVHGMHIADLLHKFHRGAAEGVDRPF